MRAYSSPVKATFTALLLLVSVLGLTQVPARGADWDPLKTDGVHDPKGPAVREKMLQEPKEALSRLAPDVNVGNKVRWVHALEQGQINPRASILPGTEVRVLDQDIFLNLKGGMPIVKFPHKQHTLWLDCANCHDHLFQSKTGATKISMLSILEGEQCGVCHGAVAFPLTECLRCHSVPRDNKGVPTDPRVLLQGLKK